MTFREPEALTFDCYGTLIDWERGILAALAPVLEAHDLECESNDLLEEFGRLEASVEAEPYRPYREVLARVLDGLGAHFGFTPTEPERAAFASSVPEWPPFADTAGALQKLATRFKLVVVTNCDDDLFAGTARHFPVQFDEVITAQQVGSYKPSPAHFHAALERLALPKERVLHVAQSLFHDIAPARELGFATVWVNRRGSSAGSGATPPASATPDFEVPDLESLVKLLGIA